MTNQTEINDNIDGALNAYRKNGYRLEDDMIKEKTYTVRDYVNNQEFFGWRNKRYTDLDIARYWAIQKSEELNAIIGLYYNDRLINMYFQGKPVKETDMTPDFILTLTRYTSR